jgi:hypothetical protein
MQSLISPFTATTAAAAAALVVVDGIVAVAVSPECAFVPIVAAAFDYQYAASYAGNPSPSPAHCLTANAFVSKRAFAAPGTFFPCLRIYHIAFSFLIYTQE